MNLREIFIALGLEWDSAGFAEAIAAEKLLEKGAALLVDVLKEIPKALAETVTATTEYGSSVHDAQLATGIAAERLQELGFAAQQTGSDAQTMWGVLTKLQNTLGEAAGGSKEAKKAFADLGVRVTDSSGKLRSADVVFSELVARLGEIQNPTERANKAFGVFSRQAAGLLPLFAEGEEGLEKAVDLFNDLSIGMSGEAAAAAETFGDSLDTARAVLEAFKHDVGGVLIAALQPVLTSLLEWVRLNRELIRSRLQQFAGALVAVFTTLLRTFAMLAKFTAWLIDNWKLFAMIIGSFLIAKFVILNALLLEQLVAWALNTTAAGLYGATVIAAGAKAAAAWLAAAAPVVLITALLTLLALAAEDLYVFLQGGDSVMGDLGKKWTEFLDSWLAEDADGDWLVIALKAVIYLLTDITDRFPKAIAEWKTMIVDFFTKTIPNAAREALAKLPGIFDPLSLHGKSFGDAMREKFPGAQMFFGGGATGPEAAAASSAAAQSVGVLAPTFNAGGFTIVAQPGQDTEQVAGAVTSTMDQWWADKLSGAAGAVGGGG